MTVIIRRMKTFLAGSKRWIVAMAIIGVAVMQPSHAVESDIRRDATVAAAEQVMPSVVNIATRTTVRDPEQRLVRWATGQPQSFSSLGSGVIIDEAGYLLTNDHVVSGADQIGVQLNEGTNVYTRSDDRCARSAPGCRSAQVECAAW